MINNNYIKKTQNLKQHTWPKTKFNKTSSVNQQRNLSTTITCSQKNKNKSLQQVYLTVEPFGTLFLPPGYKKK